MSWCSHSADTGKSHRRGGCIRKAFWLGDRLVAGGGGFNF